MNARDEAYVRSKNLVFRDVLGMGANGVVYLVYDPIYKCEFALKSVLESKFNQNEIDCMKEVDDTNVIRLYHYDYFEGSVYLLMEFCPFSLEKFIKKRDNLPFDILIRYCIGILKAIKACHRSNIAHHDIKPANFLIDKYDRIRVCDFGLSSVCQNEHKEQTNCGSVPFMGPEILTQTPHDPFKADIWAIGVTLFILATGKLPWVGDSRESLCENLMNFEPRLDIIENQELAQAIGCCLKKNPDERPTIDQLLSLTLFRETNSTFVKRIPRNQILLNVRKGYYSQSTFIVRPKVGRTKLKQIY